MTDTDQRAHDAAAEHESGTRIVRIAELEIEPAALAEYTVLLTEEIEASVTTELGVLMLYAMSIKGNPCSIRLVEIYASKDAYDAHLRSPHFLKYKEMTSAMVRSLELLEMDPILLLPAQADR